MVKGDIHVWVGTVNTVETVGNNTSIPAEHASRDASRVRTADAHNLDITFLGDPVIGKDGVDHNGDIDDAVMDQCAATATSSRILGEATAGTCVAVGSALNPSQTWVKSERVTDAAETRSKLLVRTGAPQATAFSGTLPRSWTEAWRPTN